MNIKVALPAKMQSVSAWLRDLHSHSIYDATGIAADFKKCTGLEFPAYIHRHTVRETADHIAARGLGGSLKMDADTVCVYGWEIARAFARHMIGYESMKFGRGSEFYDCIDMLERAGK